MTMHVRSVVPPLKEWSGSNGAKRITNNEPPSWLPPPWSPWPQAVNKIPAGCPLPTDLEETQESLLGFSEKFSTICYLPRKLLEEFSQDTSFPATQECSQDTSLLTTNPRREDSQIEIIQRHLHPKIEVTAIWDRGKKEVTSCLILTQNTLFLPSVSPSLGNTMAPPSSLLAATQASSARTRFSSRLKARAKDGVAAVGKPESSSNQSPKAPAITTVNSAPNTNMEVGPPSLLGNGNSCATQNEAIEADAVESGRSAKAGSTAGDETVRLQI